MAGKTVLKLDRPDFAMLRQQATALIRKLRPLVPGGLGFFLAAAAVVNRPAALVVGYVMALPAGLGGLAAASGGALGYWFFWGRAGLSMVCACLCSLLGVVFFDGTGLSRQPEFRPALAGAVTAVMHTVFALEGGMLPLGNFGWYCLNVLLAMAAAWVAGALQQERPAWAEQMALAGGILAGCQILLLGAVDVGILAAGLLVSRAGGEALLMAALCGAAVELSGVTELPMTAILCVTALAGKFLRGWRQKMLPAFLSLGAMVLLKNPDWVAPLSLILGCGGAALLPSRRKPEPVVPADALHKARESLQSVAGVLEKLEAILAAEPAPPPADAEVFDLAAERVCRSCNRQSFCWEEHGAENYRCLREAASAILEKRTAGKRDLPEEFRTRCIQPEVFVRSVNDALDRLRASRGRSARLAESRRALGMQYHFLSEYLQDTACTLEGAPAAEIRYEPEVGVCSRSRFGSLPNGDRGAQFPGPEGRYYVLLCDGMGSGPEAGREGQDALHILTGLLQAGLPAGNALDLLNSLYVLRESGGFSTVDLLELHLDTGRGVLYKWGGAPSYLKNRQFAKKIGTAAPPPGIGLGGTYRAEMIRLSLQRGQTVVLLSDGVEGEGVRQRIAEFTEHSPRALAAALVANAEGEEDDRTAAVVSLRPLLSPTQ